MERRYIFVGGLHRSGTTPLARLLGSHSQISGLVNTGVPEDEGQHLQDVYPKIRAHGGMSRFAYSEAAHLTEASPLVSMINRDRLLASWAPYWDLSRPFMLEKSPSNLIKCRFLQALFPQAYFIVIVRHPVIVALAMQKWNPRVVAHNGRRRASLSSTVEHWERAHRIFREDVRHIRRIHVLCYENLVVNPDYELEKIRLFLDLNAPIVNDEIRRGYDEGYINQWGSMSNGNPLARRQYDKIMRMRLDEASAYGYSAEDLSRSLG